MTEEKPRNNLRSYVAIVELRKIPITSWASIWCKLNRWIIPDELEHLKPYGWDSDGSLSDRMMFTKPFMDAIAKHIPEFMLSWEWNKDHMTPEQHWVWWEHKGDPDYMNEWFRQTYPHLYPPLRVYENYKMNDYKRIIP